MKHHTRNVLIALIAIIGMATLSSCEKENNAQQSKSAPNNTINGRNFTDYKSMIDALQEINEINNLEDLAAYEQRQGYASLGRISDELYESAFEEIERNFTSRVELMDFYSQNTDLLEMTYEDGENDTTISPKFEDNPYRYLADANGMFRVGNDIAKVFNNFTIAVPSNHANELLSLTDDSDFDPFDTNNVYKCLYMKKKTTIDEDGNVLDHADCIKESSYNRYYYATNSSKKRMKAVSEYVLTSCPHMSGAPYAWYFITTLKYQEKSWGFWTKKKDNLKLEVTGHYHGLPNFASPGSTAWQTHEISLSDTQNDNKIVVGTEIYVGTDYWLHRFKRLVKKFAHITDYSFTVESSIGQQTFTL